MKDDFQRLRDEENEARNEARLKTMILTADLPYPVEVNLGCDLGQILGILTRFLVFRLSAVMVKCIPKVKRPHAVVYRLQFPCPPDGNPMTFYGLLRFKPDSEVDVMETFVGSRQDWQVLDMESMCEYIDKQSDQPLGS